MRNKLPEIKHVITGQCRTCGCDVYRDDAFRTLMGDYLLCASCYASRTIPKRESKRTITETWDADSGEPYF